MPIRLPFADYRFTFQAQETITLPEYSGTLWHAVVGKALHDISCVVPQSDCQRCLLATQCDYPVLFKGVKPSGSAMMKRYQTIPPPHVLRPLSQHACTIHSGGTFQVAVVLLGHSTEKLPRLVNAMHKVASNGFRKQRKKAQLIQVTQNNPHTIGIEHHIPLQINADYHSEAIHYPLPTHIPDKIRLVLTSPFRPTGDAIYSRNFLVDKFIMAVIRRISLLQYFYTGQALEDDFPALKQHSQQVPVLHHTLQWQRHESLAKRRNQHRQGYAWSGSMELDLSKHHALWPYLYVGQWLHVGKNASMGFGGYRLVAL